jgi:small nuclear ribonucleoprotein (snRNP)-like protein
MVSVLRDLWDLCNNSRGKEVLVYLRGDKQFVGTLLGF